MEHKNHGCNISSSVNAMVITSPGIAWHWFFWFPCSVSNLPLIYSSIAEFWILFWSTDIVDEWLQLVLGILQNSIWKKSSTTFHYAASLTNLFWHFRISTKIKTDSYKRFLRAITRLKIAVYEPFHFSKGSINY